MRIPAVVISALCILLLPAAGFAVETYNSVYFDGTASITIDGDLSDWSGLNLAAPQLTFDDSNSPEPPESEDDFFATFQCCADENYMYVGVEVTDDNVVYGEERLGKAFHDDSVFIHFLNGRKEHSRSTIVIALDALGNEKMEYYENPVDQRYPYVWEALGVKSVYKLVDDGYVVEVAIPHKAFSAPNLSSTLKTSMNVEVYDDDDGIERDSAFLLDYKGWWYKDWYYTDILFEKKPASQNEEVTEVQDESEDGIEITAVIETPYQTINQDAIYSILQDTTNEDWDSAEMKLESAGDYPWVNPMLAWVQLQGRNFDSAINTFSRVIDESPDESVTIWAKYFRANTYMQKRDYTTAKTLYNDLLSTSNFVVHWNSVTDLARCEEITNGYDSAVAVYEREQNKKSLHPLLLMDLGRLHKYNKRFDESLYVFDKILSITDDQEYRYYTLKEMANVYISLDDESTALSKAGEILERRFGEKIEIAKALERAGGFDEALKLYEAIINSNVKESDIQKARLGIARNYYYKGDYITSTQIANQIIESSIDSKYKLEAERIIYSIKNKTSNE